jgi:hypothetical protein
MVSGMHKIHKTFGLFGSDVIFCVWRQSAVALIFVSSKADRKVETFLRRLSESSVGPEGSHESGLAQFVQNSPEQRSTQKGRAGKR